MAGSKGRLNSMAVEAPMLRKDVEQISGMDGMNLLYDSSIGTYHRIGSLAATIVKTFDGQKTPEDIAVEINSKSITSAHITAEHIATLVQNLEDKHLLVGGIAKRPPRKGMERLLPRYLIAPQFGKVLSPLVRMISPIYKPAPLALAIWASIIGYVLGMYVLFSGHVSNIRSVPIDRILLVAFSAMFVQLIAILFHESWHGIVSGVYGQPIRGLGVALMFWVIPVAYVDRTDAYRIRDRSPRVAIALAGMVNDGWVMGCTALVALNSSDFIYQVSTVLLGYQFLLLLANLNPFAPSDTVSALEAAMGAVDIRGRSHVLLYSKIFRTETPVYVRNISKRQRKFYILYAVLSYVFAAVVICAFIYNLILTFQHILVAGVS